MTLQMTCGSLVHFRLQTACGSLVHFKLQTAESLLVRFKLQTAESSLVHFKLQTAGSSLVHFKLQTAGSSLVHFKLQTAGSSLVHFKLQTAGSSLVHFKLQTALSSLMAGMDFLLPTASSSLRHLTSCSYSALGEGTNGHNHAMRYAINCLNLFVFLFAGVYGCICMLCCTFYISCDRVMASWYQSPKNRVLLPAMSFLHRALSVILRWLPSHCNRFSHKTADMSRKGRTREQDDWPTTFKEARTQHEGKATHQVAAAVFTRYNTSSLPHLLTRSAQVPILAAHRPQSSQPSTLY